jgi:DNA polymerase III subunit epsilon
MREIVLDTETTGIDPKDGHRIVEIGCVEVINNVPTGRTYHVYINPERDMPAEAERVHGLSEEFLKKHKVFSEIAGDFMDFIGEDPLVIHNASFDMKFLNAELGKLGFQPMPMSRSIDTLAMARRKFPGAQSSLDALCRRFGIDNSNRTLHGALLDAELLAEVYLELRGGREPGLGLNPNQLAQANQTNEKPTHNPVRPARIHTIPETEQAAHREAVARLDGSLWVKMLPEQFSTEKADS